MSIISRDKLFSGSNNGLSLTGWEHLTGTKPLNSMIGRVGRIRWIKDDDNSTTTIIMFIDGNEINRVILDKIVDK